MADFIPSADSAFDNWLTNLCQYVNQKTSGKNPEWKHIQADEIAGLNEARANWITAYEPCRKPHNKIQTAAKNTARKAAEKKARLFKHRNVDYRDEISEADLKAMGFKARDTPTPHGPPTVRPEILVETTPNRFEHKVRAINPESGSSRKPSAVHGVCYAYQVGGTRPASGADIAKTRFAQGPACTFTHTEADKGKPVYYSVCYENAKGEKGPWSPVEEAFIG